MIGDLQISAQITFNKLDLARQSPASIGETGTQVNVTGKYRSDGISDVGTGDAAFPLGSVGTIGWVGYMNLGASLIDTPAAPSVANVGTGGATTYTYKIVAIQADGGYTVASAGGSTATGNSTLNGTNFNRLTWATVDDAVSYDVYRTVGGATQGKIGNVTAATIDDTGLTADGGTAPSTTPYNFDVLISLDGGSNYYEKLRGGESHCYRVDGSVVTSVHRKAVANETRVAFMICDE